jgi:hypothetical protein
MSRIRSLKQEWLDDELASEDSDTRVLSVGLILFADDYGRGKASPDVLLGRVFPRKPMEVLARAMVGVARHRYVILYEAEERPYFQIRGWVKHQRVDHPSQGKLPKPDDPGVRLLESLEELGKFSEEFARALETVRGNPISRDPNPPDLKSSSLSPKLPDRPEKPGSARARWRRVPAEWVPKEAHFALARSLGVGIQLELDAFRDHEFNPPRQDADASFRNWIRSAARFGRKNGASKPPVQPSHGLTGFEGAKVIR